MDCLWNNFTSQEFINWGRSCKSIDKIYSGLRWLFKFWTEREKYYEFACRNGIEKINWLLESFSAIITKGSFGFNFIIFNKIHYITVTRGVQSTINNLN